MDATAAVANYYTQPYKLPMLLGVPSSFFFLFLNECFKSVINRLDFIFKNLADF